MPKGFDNCVADSGKVWRKTLAGGKYVHLCFLKGKSYTGHVHTAKSHTKEKR